jgi:hypothetical protein
MVQLWAKKNRRSGMCQLDGSDPYVVPVMNKVFRHPQNGDSSQLLWSQEMTVARSNKKQ